MKTIEIEITDDLNQVVSMEVLYSVEESEPEVGYKGGVTIHEIKGAWINVVANWVEDGELIMDIDPEKLDLADLMETIEDEVSRFI